MNLWNKAPLLRLAIPFIVGIIAAIYLQVKVQHIYFAVGGLLIALWLMANMKRFHIRYSLSWVYGFFVVLLFFIFGYQLTIEKTEKFVASHYTYFYEKGDALMAEVVEPLTEKRKSYKTILEIKALKKGDNWQTVSGQVIAYFQKDSVAACIEYGNTVLVAASLNEVSPPQNPGAFNYKQYLEFHQINNQLYAPSEKWKFLEQEPKWSIIGSADKVRKHLMSIFKKYNIEGDEFAVGSALILGYKDELDKDLRRAYASAGAMHVLAVSGLHVGIIFVLLNMWLQFVEKMKYGNIIKAVLMLLLLWFYATLTGLSPSVTRATAMFSFVVLGKASKRNTTIYNTLAASALVLLIYDPYLIMQVGFQLSYLAVIGIVFIQPKLYHLWEPDFPILGKWGNRLLDSIWTLSTVSIAAQIATFPLGLLYFHQFPNYFLFSNLVVIPLATVILYTGVFMFILSPIELLCGVLAWVLKKALWLLNASVYYIEGQPYSLLSGISINIAETWAIYIIIGLVLAYFSVINLKYIRLAFFIIIGVLCLQLFESHQQQTQRKFIVYNIKKTAAYDFVDGRKNTLVADSAFYSDENQLLFHVKHNWWEIGVEQTKFVDVKERTEQTPNLMLKDNFAQFYDKKIAVVDCNTYSTIPSPFAVDFLIISGNPKLKIIDLRKQFDFSQIIIDSSNSKWRAEKWLKEAEELEIKVHSVLHQGAFSRNI